MHFTRRAEQTMGTPAMQERLWTAAEVRDLPEVRGLQFEVIDGELFVTPSPSYDHQETALALSRRLADYMSTEKLGRAICAPADVDPTDDTLVQPDVFVIPLVDGRRARRFGEAGRLLLAIEVLSPYSVRRDQVKKRDLYGRMGTEYWIVDPEGRTVERCLPGGAASTIHRDRIVWNLVGALEPLVIDLPELFTEALGDF